MDLFWNKSEKLCLAIKNKVNLEISIIIPCFNHGLYLREAVNSIIGLEKIQYEIIIVNDGSTDSFTIQVLKELENDGYNVIHQPNLGLGAARNAGIKHAQGKYILPLDSDNKIKHEYLIESKKYLDSGAADIVYGRPEFFGDIVDARLFKTENFDISKILYYNYIDACAVYRKSVWEKNEGYETEIPYQGHEDWEFWINAYKNKFKFLFLDKPLFLYRIRKDSMIVLSSKETNIKLNHLFIINKHFDVYCQVYNDLRYFKSRYLRDMETPLITSLRYFLRFIKINLFSLRF